MEIWTCLDVWESMEPSSASCLGSQSQGAVVGAGSAWKSCSSQGDGCLGTAFQSGRTGMTVGWGPRNSSWVCSFWEEPPSKKATWWKAGGWGMILTIEWASSWEPGAKWELTSRPLKKVSLVTKNCQVRDSSVMGDLHRTPRRADWPWLSSCPRGTDNDYSLALQANYSVPSFSGALSTESPKQYPNGGER